MNNEIFNNIKIYRGQTLSGITINVVLGEYCLTINENYNIFITDSFGEVIIDKEMVPPFDIVNISDKEIKNIFQLSMSYLNFIRNLSQNSNEEVIKQEEQEEDNENE